VEKTFPRSRIAEVELSKGGLNDVKIKAVPSHGLRVTIEDIPHPAYMVNHNFELVWANERAQAEVLTMIDELPAAGEERSVFRLLSMLDTDDAIDLLRFQIALAKTRMTVACFGSICGVAAPQACAKLIQMYNDVTALPAQPVVDTLITLTGADGQATRRHAFASFYREGIFVVLVADQTEVEPMLNLLARRDEVIRSLLCHRLPVLSQLAVLVTDLQSSVKICSELPPEEYFQLINEIWAAMAPIFRKYHATIGKHAGDGMLYYFLPQPDSDHMFNALQCAHSIRQEMVRISKSWQLSKNWHNELYLNTGVHEGQEWLGTFQSSTSVEFVALGDTINQAARISEFARYGSIWASKNLVSKLPHELREKVRYGVHRRSNDGRETFVASSYAMVSSLLEQSGANSKKLRDIATLAITEVIEVASGN